MLDEDLEFFAQPFRVDQVFQRQARAQFFDFRLPRFVKIREFIRPAQRHQKLRLRDQARSFQARAAPPQIQRSEINV